MSTISPQNFRIKLIQLSNRQDNMNETDSVGAQVKTLTVNFLLTPDSCAPFETKLIKRPPARWITEAIKIKSRRKIF